MTKMKKKSLRHSLLIGFFVGIVLILMFYFFIDRPLAFWIRDCHISCMAFREMTYLASYLEWLSSLILIAAFIFFFIKKKASSWQRYLFLAALSQAIAVFLCKFFLKDFFGRTWPGTWVNNNPSLLQDDVYGFFFFQMNEGYHSFPSTHATAVFSFFSAFWLAFPRWRFIPLVICLVEVLGLLAMNYHFASDIIGGALIGCFTGILVWHTWAPGHEVYQK